MKFLVSLLSYVVSIMFLFCAGLSGQSLDFTMTQIGQNLLLDRPWDLHYGPDAHLWVTERVVGIVVRIDPETGERDELLEIPDIHSSWGQDGLLGIALHDGLLENDPYVYLSHTYLVQGERVQKIVRYTYSVSGDDGSLSSPLILMDNLPSSKDHNSGRLIFSDDKLYYTIGDQGSNQNSNFCDPILSQVLPTQGEIDLEDWTNYPGKILRINLDGSIPDDNPMMAGVRSHVFTYGHRNAQGLVIGTNGIVYSDEHGPVTDDEVNIINAGSNYGWPNVAGYRDDQAYDFCDWSSAADCADLVYSGDSCPPGVGYQEESSFTSADYQEPLLSMWAVSDNFDFNDPDCNNAWICRPNVAPSSLSIYESTAIPSWKNSLLISSLKRGRVFRLQLDDAGTGIVGDTTEHFYTTNRYRDIVIDPNGESFYILTDSEGGTSDAAGLDIVRDLENPGSILKFTYNKPLAVSDDLDEPLFTLYPNPTSKNLFLDINSSSLNVESGELIDLTGQSVLSFGDLMVGVNELSLENIPSGMYIMKLISKDRILEERLVVE